jgi:hypothetical protein
VGQGFAGVITALSDRVFKRERCFDGWAASEGVMLFSSRRGGFGAFSVFAGM